MVWASCALLALRWGVEIHEDFVSDDGLPISWGEALQGAFWEWWPWLVIAPVLSYLSLRFPIQRHNPFKLIAIHGPASLIFAAMRWVEVSYFHGAAVSVFSVHGLYFGEVTRNALSYFVFLIVITGFLAYRQKREKEAEAMSLSRQLSEAQLQMLKMQLHPHFLFNTLNGISTLMHRDVDAAEEALGQLSELLRASFSDMRVNEVPLVKELEFLGSYFELLRMRFGDSLTVQKDIEPNTLQAFVPQLILQPLLENAVEHGVGRRAKSSSIQIRSRISGKSLILEVEDNGPGLASEQEFPTLGVGLSNVKERLKTLYQGRGRLIFPERPDGGFLVRLHIPFSLKPVQEIVAAHE